MVPTCWWHVGRIASRVYFPCLGPKHVFLRLRDRGKRVGGSDFMEVVGADIVYVGNDLQLWRLERRPTVGMKRGAPKHRLQDIVDVVSTVAETPDTNVGTAGKDQ